MTTLYDRLGGREPFERLVDAFYERVERDEVLRPLYPADLAGARERLCAFVVQYFGGPRDYEALRGEPRLRLRHLDFVIDARARDAWVAAMSGAIASIGCGTEESAELLDYFERTAGFLQNQGLSLGSSRRGGR